MAGQVHVNGEARLVYNGSFLGVSEDGVDIEEIDHHFDVHADTFGGQGSTPFDVQVLGTEEMVRAALVFWDETVLRSARSNAKGGAALGTMPNPGTLLGAGGFLKTLQITGSLSKTYQKAYLVGRPRSIRVGTKRSIMQVTFRAFSYTGQENSASGAVVFT